MSRDVTPPTHKLELEMPRATIWLWLSFAAIVIVYQPTNVHWYNIVTNRGKFVMAVLQICGGPQTSIGNASLVNNCKLGGLNVHDIVDDHRQLLELRLLFRTYCSSLATFLF